MPQKSRTISKFYCQLCKVGVDDSESFKMHLLSSKHVLQKQAYDSNPAPYSEFFSNKFVRQFLRVLHVRYGTQPVSASRVYLNYLEDPKNVRLTSTKWVTFEEFMQWLRVQYQSKVSVTASRSDTLIQARVDRWKQIGQISKTESSLESNPAQLLGKRKPDIVQDSDVANKRPCIERANGDIQNDNMVTEDPFNVNQMVLQSFKPTQNEKKETDKKPWPLARDRVVVSMNPKSVKPNWARTHKASTLDQLTKRNGQSNRESDHAGLKEVSTLPNGQLSQDRLEPGTTTPPRFWRPSSLFKQPRKRSALEELREEQESRREQENRQDNWVFPGIQVRIVSKRLGSKYLHALAKVVEVKHKYTALLSIMSTADDAYLYGDQSHLRTVVPEIGGQVLIVNGAYRGHQGQMVSRQRGLPGTMAEAALSTRGTCTVHITKGMEAAVT